MLLLYLIFPIKYYSYHIYINESTDIIFTTFHEMSALIYGFLCIFTLC